jgi:hypothetical protein
MIAATAGNDSGAYTPEGQNLYSLDELLKPLHATAHRRLHLIGVAIKARLILDRAGSGDCLIIAIKQIVEADTPCVDIRFKARRNGPLVAGVAADQWKCAGFFADVEKHRGQARSHRFNTKPCGSGLARDEALRNQA